MKGPEFSTPLSLLPADQAARISKLRRLKWPLDKANYLSLMMSSDPTIDFPLSGETIQNIPASLPGEVPVSRRDLLKKQGLLKTPSKTSKTEMDRYS